MLISTPFDTLTCDDQIDKLNCLQNQNVILFTEVSKKASYITPVPGGMGPMTVAMLMKNTMMAYKKEIKFDQ